jgi:hypothetical protein
MFKKLNLVALVAATATTAFAAYGPSAPSAPAASNSSWTLGVGYGQMFGLKKTTESASTEARADKPKLLEVDLFNNSGLGLVYITSAEKSTIVNAASSDAELGGTKDKYKFHGIFGGYQKSFANNMTGRVILGVSTQEIDGTAQKSENEFAYGVSGAYHMNLSGKMNGFMELGYLGQKEFEYVTNKKVEGSGFYAKLGIKMPL